MTVTRGLSVSLLMLATTVLLVGLCGPIGLLVWLAAVCTALAMPDRCMRLAAGFRWCAFGRGIAAGWAWLDRR